MFSNSTILLIFKGQAAFHGVRENDEIMTINGKTPRDLDDAVALIKAAGDHVTLAVLRMEDKVADGIHREEYGQGREADNSRLNKEFGDGLEANRSFDDIDWEIDH